MDPGEALILVLSIIGIFLAVRQRIIKQLKKSEEEEE